MLISGRDASLANLNGPVHLDGRKGRVTDGQLYSSVFLLLRKGVEKSRVRVDSRRSFVLSMTVIKYLRVPEFSEMHGNRTSKMRRTIIIVRDSEKSILVGSHTIFIHCSGV